MKIKPKNNYCVHCKEQFSNGYEFFKHRSLNHTTGQIGRNYPGAPKVEVVIKTRRKIELSMNENINFNGVTEMVVPQESAGDIVRILTTAYGSDIIEKSEVRMIT